MDTASSTVKHNRLLGIIVHTANSEPLEGEEFAFKCPGGLYI